MPKKRITGVTLLETYNSIVESILTKNEWLSILVEEGEELKIVAILKPTDNTQSFIFNCSPKIRKHMRRVGDYIHTMYVRCKVFEKYHVEWWKSAAGSLG